MSLDEAGAEAALAVSVTLLGSIWCGTTSELTDRPLPCVRFRLPRVPSGCTVR